MIIFKCINNPLRLFYSLGIRGVFGFLNDEQFAKAMYRWKFSKRLDLDEPQTFNEKIQWLKLYDRNPNYIKLVDKYEVKRIVSKIIGEEYIIPTLGVWNDFEEIDFSKLPHSFVLKCTHDSGGIVICKNKEQFDINEARKIIKKNLSRNYYNVGREWPYKNVPPRIIAEPLLENKNEGDLRDYKVFTFNGTPKMIQVHINRFTDHRANLYDINWNNIQAEIMEPTDTSVIIDCPECLDELLDLSEKLSKGYPFVRVDFYIVNGHIFFGELTFHPDAGFGEIRPESFGVALGNWLTLPQKREAWSESS